MSAAPRLFDADSFREFLRRYAEYRRSERPGWTFGAWARRLGVSQTATLTRVINGDRDPGEQLGRALADYFQFRGIDSELWDCLLLHDKARPGSRVRALIERRIAELRRVARASLRDPAIEEPLLQIEHSHLVSLQGTGRLEVATELLRAHALAPVPINGGAYVVFNLSEHGATTAGPYAEFYLSLLACVPDRAAVDTGLFFAVLVCNSPGLASFGRVVWGNLYEVGAVSLERAPGRWRGTVVHGDARLELHVAPPAGEPSAERLEAQGYATRLRKFRVHTQSHRQFKPHDPATDRLEVSGWPQLGDLIDRLEFRPLAWEVHTDLSCQVYPPHELEADT